MRKMEDGKLVEILRWKENDVTVEVDAEKLRCLGGEKQPQVGKNITVRP